MQRNFDILAKIISQVKASNPYKMGFDALAEIEASHKEGLEFAFKSGEMLAKAHMENDELKRINNELNNELLNKLEDIKNG